MDKHEFDRMNSTVISEFRATGGKAGGVFSGKPLILLHHIGAKSGTERISPLVPLLYDGHIFVFASKGGSDRNPDWYGNLVAQPNVTSNSAPKRSRQQRGRLRETNAMAFTRSRAPSNRNSAITNA